MNEELTKLNNLWLDIKSKMGQQSFEMLEKYYATLWRKIEDLTTSRDLWKNKFIQSKGGKS